MSLKNLIKGSGSDAAKPSLEATVSSDMPIIASARTGLASKDDALVRRVPATYEGKTVRDLLNYITTTEVTSEESDLAESVKREVAGRQSVVMINGKKAELTDLFDKYATIASHDLPGGAKKQYKQLEIEVSSVQQGGYRLN
ncbi:hypothetical protein KA107_02670 [Candidatus Pacearchaeota archaeon]|nr:hypothetical protein [Candidatus Pacearchaeota archaeon]